MHDLQKVEIQMQQVRRKDNIIYCLLIGGIECKGSKIMLPFYGAFVRPHLENCE